MSVRMTRRGVVSVSDMVDAYIRDMKIASGLNTQRIFEAWDACSGASAYTLKKFFRDGKLYVTLGSSMVRNQLFFQKDLIMKKINDCLLEDDLFVKDDPKVGLLREIILK